MARLQKNLEVLKAEDPAYLSILDTSFYPETPESATIHIYVPGYDTAYQLAFGLGKVNVFNSYSFGFTTSATQDFAPLPDGLYKLDLITCPDTGSQPQYHLRTSRIDCRLMNQWAKYVNTMEKLEGQPIHELEKVEFYLKGAQAHAYLCNPELAKELYTKANDLLKRVEDSCC
jgi:hypothetical protein